jgi:hypothetical protein
VDPCIDPLCTGTRDRRGVEAEHLVTRPEIGRGVVLDVDRHALDQRGQVGLGATHLLVQPDLGDAWPAALRHDRHRLPQRQVRPRVQQDQPEQHLRARHLQVRPLWVQEPMLDRELLVIFGQVRHQRLPVVLRGECLHRPGVPEDVDDGKPHPPSRLTLVGQSLETNYTNPPIKNC